MAGPALAARAWRTARQRAVLSGAALVAAALSAGCVEPHAGSDPAVDDERPPVANAVIDAGGAVELEPGAGVGVAIGYAGAGRWQLTTACDTAQTNDVCRFDVFVSSDASDEELSDGEGVDLEAEDEISLPDPFALELLVVTEDDLDGMTFRASPGAAVRVSVLLYDPLIDSPFDWTDDPRLLSWVGHGAVNWGAPSNPIDLTPDQP
ncbi:MAG: hypothetical protein ABI895_01545 [Deltaproteobacteria bacterium]